MIKKIVFYFFVFCSFSYTYADNFYFQDNEIFHSSVYIESVGNPQNPAVVFVHGLGDEASTIWKDTVEFLKEDYFVLVFDLPGFRNSQKSNTLYSPKNYAMLINTIAKKYIQKPFHLVGHSLGGAISLQYAGRYGDTLLTLTLIDAAGILHRSTYSKFLALNRIDKFFYSKEILGELFQTPKLNRFINNLTEKIDNKMTLDVDEILESSYLRSSLLMNNTTTIAALALVQTNFSDLVETVDTNTLLIWGEEDSVAPIQTGYVLNKLLPYASMRVVPQAGHVPMLTHKDTYLSYLKEHLQHSERYVKVKKNINSTPKIVMLQDANADILSGYIQKATIRNSTNIVIKDAIIEELEIINSNVEILNSTYLGKKELIVQNTSLALVASQIDGDVLLNNSTLNVAGTSVNGNFKIIQDGLPSTLIYSLSKKNGYAVHGRFVIDKKNASKSQ